MPFHPSMLWGSSFFRVNRNTSEVMGSINDKEDFESCQNLNCNTGSYTNK